VLNHQRRRRQRWAGAEPDRGLCVVNPHRHPVRAGMNLITERIARTAVIHPQLQRDPAAGQRERGDPPGIRQQLGEVVGGVWGVT